MHLYIIIININILILFYYFIFTISFSFFWSEKKLYSSFLNTTIVHMAPVITFKGHVIIHKINEKHSFTFIGKTLHL